MTDFNHTADLWSLLAVIAGSPIVLAEATAQPRDFAEWCERQKPADIDTVILGWIRSHIRSTRRIDVLPSLSS